MRPRTSGFTLIELLMVIAIIGVLAGLLYPVVGAALRNAERMQCIHNLEQIAQGVIAYTSQFGGGIPPAAYVENPDDTPEYLWCNLLVSTGHLSAPDTHEMETSANLQDSLSEEDSVFICPATALVRVEFADVAPLPNDDEACGWYRCGTTDRMLDSTYYWNGCTERGTTEDQQEALRDFPSLLVVRSEPVSIQRSYVHNISEIRQRTTMVMVADGVWTDAWNRTGNLRGRVATRHPGDYSDRCVTNIAFYDGHVESYIRWPDPEEETPTWEEDELIRKFGEREEEATLGIRPLCPREDGLPGGPPYFRLSEQPVVLTN